MMDLVAPSVTVSEVENSFPAAVRESAGRWKEAGRRIKESAADCRSIGLDTAGVWEGTAATAANHRANVALNAVNTSGNSAQYIGLSAGTYAQLLASAKSVLVGLRTGLGWMLHITEHGQCFTPIPIPAAQKIAAIATGITQTALRLVGTMQKATGATIHALAELPQPMVAAGLEGLTTPTSDKPHPTKQITLPAGTATVVGNIESADRIITLIGGVGSESDGARRKQETFAQNLAGTNDTGEKIAVVSWNGYNAPDNLTQGAIPIYAHKAAAGLRHFQDTLREQNPDATLHVSGYSYGSVVVGAAARSGTLDADRVTFLGSPGVLAHKASDLQLNKGARVKSHVLPGDAIEVANTAGGIGEALASAGFVHGTSPNSPEFGAEKLITDDTPGTNTSLRSDACHNNTTAPNGFLSKAGDSIASSLVHGLNHTRLLATGDTSFHSAYYHDANVLAAMKETR